MCSCAVDSARHGHTPAVVTSRLRQAVRNLRQRLRVVSYALRRPLHPDESRAGYQQAHLRFRFAPGMRVLDIGSGGDPFPHATVLADRYLEPTRHRASAFRAEGRPVVICDIHHLPFAADTFDYVVCAHVLEHVDEPGLACAELQRVAGAGLVETPTLMKDVLFAWARGMHRWHLTAIARRLVFFEYSERQLDGIGRPAWQEVIFGAPYHPLQAAFAENQDLFNVIFEWSGGFEVTVMWLNGEVREYSARQRASSHAQR
jgi:hypothetical protein